MKVSNHKTIGKHYKATQVISGTTKRNQAKDNNKMMEHTIMDKATNKTNTMRRVIMKTLNQSANCKTCLEEAVFEVVEEVATLEVEVEGVAFEVGVEAEVVTTEEGVVTTTTEVETEAQDLEDDVVGVEGEGGAEAVITASREMMMKNKVQDKEERLETLLVAKENKIKSSPRLKRKISMRRSKVWMIGWDPESL